MCLAVPGKVVEIGEKNEGVVDFMGIRKKVALDLLQDVSPGDYVIVHAGFAINKLNEEEARETFKYFDEIVNRT